MKLREFPKFRKLPNFWEVGNTTGSTSEVSECQKTLEEESARVYKERGKKKMEMERRERKKEKSRSMERVKKSVIVGERLIVGRAVDSRGRA